MYKVKTNQVDVPFDQLHIPGEGAAKTASQAVEEAVAQLREEARQVQAHAQAQAQASATDNNDRPFPKLLPAPVLKPTAYSSRMIYDTALPSSPPASKSPERGTLAQQMSMLAQQISTPARPHVRQLSSPPDSAERDAARRDVDMDVTSSVVKGRVAEGLLGLRNVV